MSNNKIGVFDSGVGGLTVLYQLLKYLPNEEYIYFGDTARVPYGTKSRETIMNFSRQNINFLLSKGVKTIVVACNSASSNGIETIKKEYDIPIFDVIGPTVKNLSRKISNIGIIGTYATIESKSYDNKIKKKFNNKLKIFHKACPLLVPLAEEGLNNTSISKITIEHYLKEFRTKDLDSLIMGCTHYPLFKKEIRDFFEGKVKLINPGKMVAKEVTLFLKEKEMLGDKKSGWVEFYLSDIPRNFQKIVRRFLGKKVENFKRIDIERYK
ncbi:glutamate racemase [bacterium]|nr:glutamate racemase [bacterium]